MNQEIEQAEKDLLHTYNRFPVVFDHGEGVHLYDTEGKEYLDFCAGIAVFALGYGVKEYNDALKDQVDKLIHTSNYFYNEPAIKAAALVKKYTGMDRVFFTNSGGESIEGALKAARKYAYTRDGHTDHEIIAMEHSFHGRTMGALSVTGNAHYREPFEPLIGNIKFAEYNNLESVEAQITDKTCAIIMETVQGEGGIYPANPEFIQGVRRLCDEKDILLILDEIQCGMGRTGTMYAYEQYGVKPDILATAKALGCGVPVGAFAMTERVALKSLTAGDHGSTYGGNPLACRAICSVYELMEEKKVLENVNRVSIYLEQKLSELVERYDFIETQRGLGLMRGLVFDCPVNGILQKTLKNGLVLINAGTNILRFVPPLVITKQDVDDMLVILTRALDEWSYEERA
ncbi:MAG: aspartate aminotransferase family protein [Lachnospiraceae bacterium]|nr:aspartate aminotransferase family protein [Lachnospiraceae bacterium]